MLTTLRNTLVITLIGFTGGPSLAATCNMTVLGASVLDDASCAVTRARAVTEVQVENGGTIDIKGSIMSARLAGNELMTGRRRKASTSYGQVVTSVDTDNKTCYANIKAVLCVEP